MKKAVSHAMLVVAAMLIGTAAHAAYPDRPIKIIVPYGAGQATDIMCRVFIEQLRETLQATLVIENRPGGGSNLGAAEAARAQPDGYTLLCTGNATHVANPLIYSHQGLDPDNDLIPISGVAATGYVLAVGNKLKDKTLKDVIAMAKSAAQPLKAGLASTTSRVIYGMFQQAAKIDLASVPYAQGNQGLFPDLMRGDTDLVIEAMPSALAAIASGQVQPIAVTLPERSPLMPNVPTFKEGEVNVVLVGWNGFYAPHGTPPAIITKLNAASAEALKAPIVAKRLEAIACVPMPTTPDGLSKMIRDDRAKWKPLVDLYQLKVD